MPKQKMVKTTDEESDFFVRRVHFWQEMLNLMDWRIDAFTSVIEATDRTAQVVIDFRGKCAAITLAAETQFGWTKIKLDRSAFHECCEIFLSQLGIMAERFYAKGEVEERVHEIIRTLENAVVPKIRGKL